MSAPPEPADKNLCPTATRSTASSSAGFWQPNARRNSGKLATDPSTRQRTGLWTSLPTCSRTASGRSLVRQLWAKAMKNRWSGVKPSIGRQLLALGRQLERRVGHAQAADVGDVLAQRLMAVDMQPWQHLVGVVLPGHELGPLLNPLRVVGGPPVFQVACRVVLPPLVVEAVRQSRGPIVAPIAP